MSSSGQESQKVHLNGFGLVFNLKKQNVWLKILWPLRSPSKNFPTINCVRLCTQINISNNYNKDITRTLIGWKSNALWEYKTWGKSCHAIYESHHVSYFRVKKKTVKRHNGKLKKMLFFFLDKESFRLRNRPTRNSKMFSSRRNAKCPVLKLTHGSGTRGTFLLYGQEILSRIRKNFACGIQNPGLWNPEFTAQGIRILRIHWNPESKFHWQRLKSST